MLEWIPRTELGVTLGGLFLVFVTTSGCGTSRFTDTPRSTGEELLVTHSIDKAVGCLNLSVLSGHRVFLDTQYLNEVAYRGYLTSALRQQLVASDCRIAPNLESAQIVLEARAGTVSTSRNDSLIGIPQTILPTVVPGVPSAIPEIALIKRTIQLGVAQVTVFAYRVDTGAGIWQSGAKQSRSTLESRWYFGGGPYQRGDRVVTGPNPSRPPCELLHSQEEAPTNEADAPGLLTWEAMLGELPPIAEPTVPALPYAADPPEAPPMPDAVESKNSEIH